MLLGQFLHLREGFQLLAAADDHGRRLLAEQLVQRFIALFRGKAGQKIHLGQTHDLQPKLIKIIVVARQKQTRTVDFRDLNADVFEVLRRIDHIHADFFGQLLERNGKIRHRSSSCVVSSLRVTHLPADTPYFIISEMVSDYNVSFEKSPMVPPLHPPGFSL